MEHRLEEEMIPATEPEAPARARGLTALRQFLAFLVDEGFPLWGIDVGPAVDVDHPEDVARAEAFLKEGRLT